MGGGLLQCPRCHQRGDRGSGLGGPRRCRRGAMSMKKTHDYVHYYRGYWSEGGKCRIRIYHEDRHTPVVVCSELPDNDNTFVTNMAEYLAAEVMEKHKLPTPLVWIEHCP